MVSQMRTEKASFVLVGGLYLAVVAVGFHAEAPPLAPTSLFLAATTLVIIGHLVHLHQIAPLVRKYPRWAFCIDFVAVAILSWIFKLLIWPQAGGLGGFPWPQWGHDAAFRQFVAGIDLADPTELYRRALNRFFVLGVCLLLTLMWWHRVTWNELKQQFFLNRHEFYLIGWTLFGALDVFGIAFTWGPRQSLKDWDLMVERLSFMSVLAVISAAGFLIVAELKEVSYKTRNPTPAYLMQFRYTTKAWRHLPKVVEHQANLFTQLLEELGGTPIKLYQCFGAYDGVLVFEAPDDTVATSFSVRASSPHLKAAKTTSLYTVEETISAAREAMTKNA